MRGLTLIGSGWHPHLFRAEIKALTGPLEVIHPRVVYIPHTDSAIRRLSRAALLNEVLSSAGRVWLHTSITDGELAQHIAEWQVRIFRKVAWLSVHAISALESMVCPAAPSKEKWARW